MKDIYIFNPNAIYSKIKLSCEGTNLTNDQIYITETESFEAYFPDIFQDCKITTKVDLWPLSNKLS